MKIRSLILFALTSTHIHAGTVTTTPTKDSNDFIIIGKDQNVTFTAAGSGIVITSLSAPGATVTGGFGSYTATFTSEPVNQLCTLTVASHTVIGPEGPIPCTENKQFTFQVIVPKVTEIYVDSSDTTSHHLGAEDEKDIIATTKGSGNVQLIANVEPNLDGVIDKLAWSGATVDGNDKGRATLGRASGKKVDVEASFSGLSSGKRGAEVYVLSGTFKTPSGSPVEGPGQNEFVYSEAATGILEIKLEAELTGITSPPSLLTDAIAFEVDEIPGSTLGWDASNTNGKAKISGENLSASVKFTGLPPLNSSFGLKKARLTFSGESIAPEAEFEVFYPKFGTNHPPTTDPYDSSTGQTPNIFFYSVQVLKPGAGGAIAVYSYAEGTQPCVQTGIHPDHGWVYAVRLGGGQFFMSPVQTIAHENKHIENHFVEVWGKGRSAPGTDSDDDLLKDSWEMNKWSSLINDFDYFYENYDEPLAKDAHDNFPLNIADGQAWYHPGPNSK